MGRTLHGELLRDAPENMVDTKLFVLKDHGIVCHSFIFSGCDKSGANVSGLSLIIPFPEFKSYLPFIELVEERVKILIAKLRVLQAKVHIKKVRVNGMMKFNICCCQNGDICLPNDFLLIKLGIYNVDDGKVNNKTDT